MLLGVLVAFKAHLDFTVLLHSFLPNLRCVEVHLSDWESDQVEKVMVQLGSQNYACSELNESAINHQSEVFIWPCDNHMKPLSYSNQTNKSP